jgi:hypothetical protein
MESSFSFFRNWGIKADTGIGDYGIGYIIIVLRDLHLVQRATTSSRRAIYAMPEQATFYPWPKSAIQVTKSSCIGQGGKNPCLPAPKHTAFAAFAALAGSCWSRVKVRCCFRG